MYELGDLVSYRWNDGFVGLVVKVLPQQLYLVDWVHHSKMKQHTSRMREDQLSINKQKKYLTS